MDFLKNLFDDNARDIKKYQKKVDKINGLEAEFQALSDERLAAKTQEFKQRLDQGKHWMIFCPRLLRWSGKHPKEF